MDAFARLAFVLLALPGLSAIVFPSYSPVPERRDARASSIFSRLPNETRPISYDIHLKTRVDQGDFSFSGRVKIVVQVKNATNQIIVHARQLEIKSISLNTAYYVPEDIPVTHTYDNVTEFLAITATDKVLSPRNYYLVIEYNGELRKDNAGFYVSTFNDENNNTINIAATQFQLTDARHAFPCYDEPQIKGIFKIAIRHGSNYSAISNMPVLEGPIDNGDGTSTTKFQQTTLMSTYLLAFSVFNFEYSEMEGRVPHRIYSRIGTEADRSFALTTSVQTLEAVEEYLNVDYNLPKMDNIALPDFAPYAMENWGLAMYREEFLLLKDKQSTTETQINIVEIMCHEYGHQWFGNLVSPDWWTFLWLNEGFAVLLSYIASDMVFPEWDFMQRFHVREFQYSLEFDGKQDSPPMTNYVESINSFSFVAYSKAASVLMMIQHALTDDVFRKTLKYYLNDMEYSAATEDDLFRNFQTAVDEFKPFGDINVDVSQLFKSWTNQPGYPLLTVTRNYNRGTFVISQSPFDGTRQTPISDKRSWWVPFNIATGRNPHYKETTMHDWLNVGEESKEIFPSLIENWINSDWIILNKRSTIYYRINYDLNNWKLLTTALITKPLQFHVHNRAQLLDDAFAFVLSNRMSFPTFLDLSVYLKNEHEYSPWYTANSYLTKINLYLSGGPDYDLFQYYVGKIVENFYIEIGITENDDDEHLTKLSRAYAINWACEANIGDCLEQSRARLREYIQTGKGVEPNLRSSIFCNGLKEAGEVEYEFMLGELMASTDQAFRSMLMNDVMGCMQNVTLLEKYLQLSIQYNNSINFNSQERISLLPGVITKGPIQLEVVIDFLMANNDQYSKLISNFGFNPLMLILRTIANRVVTHEQNYKFEQLLTTLNDFTQIQGGVKSLRAVVDANLDWISKYRNELIVWLSKFKEKEEGGEGGDGDRGATIFASTSAMLLLITVSLLSFF